MLRTSMMAQLLGLGIYPVEGSGSISGLGTKILQAVQCDQKYIFVVCCLVTQSYPTPSRSHGLQPTSLLYPWDSPGKNIGVGCHALLQGIPDLSIELALLLGRQIFYHWEAYTYTYI